MLSLISDHEVVGRGTLLVKIWSSVKAIAVEYG
jgi:hypothetical protein